MVKKILLFAAFISIFVVFALPPVTTRNVVQSPQAPRTAIVQHKTPQDTTLHFPVNNLVKNDTNDLLKKYPVDLKTPQNIQTSVV